MKKSYTYFAISALTCLLSSNISLASHPTDAEVYFSPKGGAQEAILNAIDNAQKNVYVEAFLFNYPPMVKALIKAHQRGVDVKVIMDRRAALTRKNSLGTLANHEVPTYLDGDHKTAHNKVILVDDDKVLTGSFNFFYPSEKNNAENLLVLHSKDLAKQYREDWSKHLSHSLQVDANQLKELRDKEKEEQK